MRICENCGAAIDHTPKRNRFCDRSCSAQWRMRQPAHRELMRAKVWDDPAWRAQSARTIREVRQRPEVVDFMDSFNRREGHPFQRPEVKAKSRAAQQKAGFAHLNGGNGRPPSPAESTLHAALGWELRGRVTVGDGEHPRHYELDLLDRARKVGVEIDGRSHRHSRGRAADARKDARLEATGWKVLRFTNEDVLADPEGCAAHIMEASRA